MSGFSADWLDLRAPADSASRDPGLLAEAAQIAAGQKDALVVDLGCGSGAMFRALDPMIRAAGGDARWLLVDGDATLLAEARRRHPDDRVAIMQRNLDGPLLPLEGATLVTASALLDLAAPPFMERLANALEQAEATLYAPLTYDGRMGFFPAHPADKTVHGAFDRHQRGDKGFGGPALGPKAVPHLQCRLERRGYTVTLADSAWRLTASDAPLVEALLEGIASAASETGLVDARNLADWLAFRRAHVADGTLTVGHLDLLAIPA